MITVLLEQPVPILIVGLLAAAAMGLAFVSTGRLHFAGATLAVLAITGGLLAVEWFVETEREQIENVIYATGAAIQANDVAGVLERISPQSPAVRASASQRLAMVTVSTFSIKNIHSLDVNLSHRPPLAVAELNFVVSGSFTGEHDTLTYPANLKLTFRREDGGWRITRYELYEYKPGARLDDLRKLDEAGGSTL